jgi:hypothetical protein
LNPNFIKAYYRKAQALYEMTHVPGNDLKAIETLRMSLEVAKKQPDNSGTCEAI